jgi:hypothetical protein
MLLFGADKGTHAKAAVRRSFDKREALAAQRRRPVSEPTARGKRSLYETGPQATGVTR